MLLTVFFVICCLLFIVSIIKNTVSSPLTIFLAIWMAIIGFYSLRLFDLYDVSENTQWIFFFGVVSWTLGASLLPNVAFVYTFHGKPISLIPEKLEPNIRYYLAFGIMTLIMGSAAFNGVKAVFSGASLHDIRYLLRNDILSFGSDNSFSTILYLYLGTPLSYLMMHYNMVRVLNNVNLKTSIVELVFIAFLSLLSIGGRFILLYLGVDFLLILFLRKSKNKENISRKSDKKIKRIVVFLIILLFVGFVYMTINGGSKVFSTIYSYTCGCVPLLEKKIAEFETYGDYTFGVTCLNGFIRPIFTFLRAIGVINELPFLVQQSEKYLGFVETVSSISPNGTFNGFVSMFYSMYVDFGILGVIIISFLSGRICNNAYNRMRRSMSDLTVLVYFMLMQAVAVSMLRFSFDDYKYALSFVYLLLIFGSKKRTEYEE